MSHQGYFGDEDVWPFGDDNDIPESDAIDALAFMNVEVEQHDEQLDKATTIKEKEDILNETIKNFEILYNGEIAISVAEKKNQYNMKNFMKTYRSIETDIKKISNDKENPTRLRLLARLRKAFKNVNEAYDKAYKAGGQEYTYDTAREAIKEVIDRYENYVQTKQSSKSISISARTLKDLDKIMTDFDNDFRYQMYPLLKQFHLPQERRDPELRKDIKQLRAAFKHKATVIMKKIKQIAELNVRQKYEDKFEKKMASLLDWETDIRRHKKVRRAPRVAPAAAEGPELPPSQRIIEIGRRGNDVARDDWITRTSIGTGSVEKEGFFSRDDVLIVMRAIKRQIRGDVTAKKALQRVIRSSHTPGEWKISDYRKVLKRVVSDNSDFADFRPDGFRSEDDVVRYINDDSNKNVYNAAYSKCYIYKLLDVNGHKIDRIKKQYTGRPGDAPKLFLTDLLKNHTQIFYNHVVNINQIPLNNVKTIKLKMSVMREYVGKANPHQSDNCKFKYDITVKVTRETTGETQNDEDKLRILWSSLTIKTSNARRTKCPTHRYKMQNQAECVPRERRKDFKQTANVRRILLNNE
jgi:hypothetical protein